MFLSSQLSVVITDVEVERVFLPVRSRKAHDVEERLIVLHQLHADGTPLPEMLGYIVMLRINPCAICRGFDYNGSRK